MSSIFGGKNNSRQTTSQTSNETSSTSLSPWYRQQLEAAQARVGGMEYQGVGADQIAAFMNPYQSQVTDATMAELDAQRQGSRNGLLADVAKSDAFGNSRRGIVEAELEGQYDRTTASTLAGLNSGGYQQALNAALAESTNRNQYGLGIEALLAQILGQGREGTTVSSGSATGTQRGRGTQFGFSWSPQAPTGGG